jgi:hypothetical protein
MRRWQGGVRSKPALCIAVGAAVAVFFSTCMLLAGSSWTTANTQSVLMSLARPGVYDQRPRLQLLNCLPGCERHGNCNREVGTCRWVPSREAVIVRLIQND